MASKLLSSPQLIYWALVGFALQAALFIPAATSSINAAGENEGILLQGEKVSSEGSFQFFFEANAGQTYPIVASLDLIHWTVLTNLVWAGSSVETVVSAASGPAWIEEHSISKMQRHFYRIGLPPTPVPNMVFVSPGTFTMGSPESEAGRASNEGPQTEVTLSRGFWIGKYEVRQQEYIAVMGSNHSAFSYDVRLPLDSQTWTRATNYCYMLTLQERAASRLPPGYIYRLPTEAEWEYACRAGTTAAFGIGDGTSLSSTQANFDGTFPYGGAAPGRYLSATTLGGTYPPNDWGLYDMHGNLWEWCQDWYGPYPGGKVTDPKGPETGSAHVLRGGGYTSPGQGCRSAKRDSRSPNYDNTIQGFRVVLAQDP